MLRVQGDDLFERFLPAFHRLPRKSRHEIHVDIGKTGFPRQLKAFEEFFPGVDPAQLFQFLRICGLKTEA